MNVLLGSVKPSWCQLCVQVDLIPLSPPYPMISVWQELPPPPSFGSHGWLEPGLVPYSSVANWFSPIITINFNISLLLPMRKSKLPLILGCYSACVQLGPLAA